jgi:hypothetical protein
MDAVHTGVVQTKPNAGRADWFLFDQKKNNNVLFTWCKATFYCKNLEPNMHSS